MVSRIIWSAALLALAAGGTAFAQTPTAPMANPSTWQMGGEPTMPLHFIGPVLTGRPAKDLPVASLKVPHGFTVEVWADGVANARSMALGAKGTLFVGNLAGKNVYAITDHGGKREVKTLLSGLDVPNGLVFSKGTLFVAERTRISRYDDIESHLDKPPAPKLMVTLPENKPIHFWHYLAMGPE
jgi:glucose/arabinose dehydrogenase